MAPLFPKAVSADAGRRIHMLGLDLRVVLGAADTGGTMELVEMVGPPGSGIPPHVHTREDEGFMILEGEVEFTVAGQQRRLNAGDTVFGPRGSAHGFQVVGTRPLRMYFWVMPATLEPMFDELAALAVPSEPQEVTLICQRFGITFVQEN